LVAAYLALEDSQIRLESQDLSKFAVVFGSGFGCAELTEAYLKTIADCGWGRSDPIVFPDTLHNFPASHVARQFNLKGPNITVSSRGISGEAALIQAASLIENGEADKALVIAGDTLNRPLYEWYQTAGVLSSAFSDGRSGPSPLSRERDGFVPGEGLGVFVVESDDAWVDRGAKVYAVYRSGCLGGDPSVAPFSWGRSGKATIELINRALGSADPTDVMLVVAGANGSLGLDALEIESIREVFGGLDAVDVVAPKAVLGEFDGNAVLRLTVALSGLKRSGDFRAASDPAARLLLLLGASAGGGRAALTFLVP
jgi:3-oxoacyl-[acyl-carrier-protein] synthase II